MLTLSYELPGSQSNPLTRRGNQDKTLPWPLNLGFQRQPLLPTLGSWLAHDSPQGSAKEKL